MRSRGVVIIVVIAALAAGAYVVAHRPPHAQQAKAVYYCPMHPTYTSDRPGNCPICNMKLV